MERKKMQIIQSAHKLFWKFGFKRITVEEVCRDSKVSKMTFYRYFPNKIELAKAVFDNAAEEGITRFKQLLAASRNSEDFVKNLLLLKLESTENISQEFLQDFYGHPELGLKEYVEQKTKLEWQLVLKELKNAQKKGLIRKDINLDFFYQLVMKMGDIVSDEQFMKGFKKPQDLIIALAKLLTHGIVVTDQT